jgi:hypothetical protein
MPYEEEVSTVCNSSDTHLDTVVYSDTVIVDLRLGRNSEKSVSARIYSPF